MTRVTVCIDKVKNGFELVLLAVHRARSIGKGSQLTVVPENDRNGVAALREIASKTIPPGDILEGLIHSMQRSTQIDEAEATAVPTLPRHVAVLLRRDVQSPDSVIDMVTEEQLLRGMEKLLPQEASTNNSSNGSGS